MEFGVNQGGTINFIAKRMPSRRIHGFDSFEGLPESWTGNQMEAGSFNNKGRMPKVPANVALHKGWFADTLPGWVAANRDADRAAARRLRSLFLDQDHLRRTSRTRSCRAPSSCSTSTSTIPPGRCTSTRPSASSSPAPGTCRYLGYSFQQVVAVMA